jgi:hypothetical protein
MTAVHAHTLEGGIEAIARALADEHDAALEIARESAYVGLVEGMQDASAIVNSNDTELREWAANIVAAAPERLRALKNGEGR